MMFSRSLRFLVPLALLATTLLIGSGCVRRTVTPIEDRVPPTDAAEVAEQSLEAEMPVVDEASEVATPESPREVLPPMERAAYAGVIDDERFLMQGADASGRFGDFVLRNANVHAIITAADHAPGTARSGGVLADISSTARRIDNFGYFATAALPEMSSFHFVEEVVVARDGSDADDPAAEIITRGTIITLPGITFETSYVLAPGDDALTITTTWMNSGDATSQELNPMDSIDWGRHTSFLPYYGEVDPEASARVEHEATWMAGYLEIDDASLLLFAPGRAFASTHLKHLSSVSFGFRRREARALEPGDSLKLVRKLLPGTRNLAASSNRVLKEQGLPTGEIVGRVVDTTDNHFPVPFARIRIDEIRRGDLEQSRPRLYTYAYSDGGGEFEIRVPAGEYVVRGDHPTRQQPPRNYSQFLDPGAVVEKEIYMAPPYRLAFEARDQATGELMPCKLTLIPLRGSRYPAMGPAWEVPFARNTYYSLTGRGTVDVPRGQYRVIITRGPEYSAYSEEVLVERKHAVEPLKIDARLAREVDTTGWIAVDLGSRTSASWDSLVSEEDRVISAVAEGVEVIIPLDSNVVTDLRDEIERLNLGSRIKAGLGVQWRDPARAGFGVWSAYPLPESIAADELAAGIAQIGALDDPTNAFTLARDVFPEAVLQIDQPVDAEVGYLMKYGYTGGPEEPLYAEFGEGYSANFDVIEVLRGRARAGMDIRTSLEPWYQLVLGGDDTKRFTATSGSRSIHEEETGYPRLYVRSSTDDPAQVDLAEIAQNIREGKVLITMGPFLKFDINGKGPGEWATLKDERWAYVDMLAYGPRWLPVGFVEALKDGYLQYKALSLAGTYPFQFPGDGADPFVRRTRALRDWTVVLTAVGREETMEPYLPAVGDDQTQAPVIWAITGPIFLDVDDDGVFTPPPPSRRSRD